MKKLLSIILSLFFIGVFTESSAQQNGNKEVNKGNEAYRKGDFATALKFYDQALKINPSNEFAKVNKGIAYNKTNKTEEATKAYNEALKSVRDAGLRSTVNYNKGVNSAKQEKYREAIDDFKEALRKMPQDQKARENLQLAINKLKQEQQKDQQDKNKDKGGGGQDQQKQQNEQQQQNQDKNNMNKEQAERYLDNLREEEKNLQNKIMKRSAGEGQRETQKGW